MMCYYLMIRSNVYKQDKLLEKSVGKQRISKDDATAARERLSTSTKMEDLSGVDFVIEAVPVPSGTREMGDTF